MSDVPSDYFVMSIQNDDNGVKFVDIKNILNNINQKIDNLTEKLQDDKKQSLFNLKGIIEYISVYINFLDPFLNECILYNINEYYQKINGFCEDLERANQDVFRINQLIINISTEIDQIILKFNKIINLFNILTATNKITYIVKYPQICSNSKDSAISAFNSCFFDQKSIQNLENQDVNLKLAFTSIFDEHKENITSIIEYKYYKNLFNSYFTSKRKSFPEEILKEIKSQDNQTVPIKGTNENFDVKSLWELLLNQVKDRLPFQESVEIFNQIIDYYKPQNSYKFKQLSTNPYEFENQFNKLIEVIYTIIKKEFLETHYISTNKGTMTANNFPGCSDGLNLFYDDGYVFLKKLSFNGKPEESKLDIFTNPCSKFIVKVNYSNTLLYHMPYFPYGNLHHLIEMDDKKIQLTLIDKIVIIKEIAIALKDLHKNDKSHGSLASCYIFIDSNKDACIGDIYQAKPVNDSTLVDLVDYYRDPEIRSDLNNSKLADIYSLGILMYEIVTSTSPKSLFAKNETKQKISDIMKSDKYKERLFDDKANEILNNVLDIKGNSMIGIKGIIERCISKQNERFQSMDDVIDRLTKLALYERNKDEIEKRIEKANPNSNCSLFDIIKCYYHGQIELIDVIRNALFYNQGEIDQCDLFDSIMKKFESSEKKKNQTDAIDDKNDEANNLEEPAVIENEEANNLEEPAVIENEEANNLEEPAVIENEEANNLEEPAAIENEETNNLEEPAALENEETNNLEEPAALENEEANNLEEPVVIENEEAGPISNDALVKVDYDYTFGFHDLFNSIIYDEIVNDLIQRQNKDTHFITGNNQGLLSLSIKANRCIKDDDDDNNTNSDSDNLIIPISNLSDFIDANESKCADLSLMWIYMIAKELSEIHSHNLYYGNLSAETIGIYYNSETKSFVPSIILFYFYYSICHSISSQKVNYYEDDDKILENQEKDIKQFISIAKKINEPIVSLFEGTESMNEIVFKLFQDINDAKTDPEKKKIFYDNYYNFNYSMFRVTFPELENIGKLLESKYSFFNGLCLDVKRISSLINKFVLNVIKNPDSSINQNLARSIVKKEEYQEKKIEDLFQDIRLNSQILYPLIFDSKKKEHKQFDNFLFDNGKYIILFMSESAFVRKRNPYKIKWEFHESSRLLFFLLNKFLYLRNPKHNYLLTVILANPNYDLKEMANEITEISLKLNVMVKMKNPKTFNFMIPQMF